MFSANAPQRQHLYRAIRKRWCSAPLYQLRTIVIYGLGWWAARKFLMAKNQMWLRHWLVSTQRLNRTPRLSSPCSCDTHRCCEARRAVSLSRAQKHSARPRYTKECRLFLWGKCALCPRSVMSVGRLSRGSPVISELGRTKYDLWKQAPQIDTNTVLYLERVITSAAAGDRRRGEPGVDLLSRTYYRKLGSALQNRAVEDVL